MSLSLGDRISWWCEWSLGRAFVVVVVVGSSRLGDKADLFEYAQGGVCEHVCMRSLSSPTITRNG